ncbi:hypothetical protein [Clostridium tyrobutyricum]|uniref:hypothetical protein n=1 Tax=Clostridium tyrobutyricum TaxID=1519 RepID=UPI00073DAEF0|nr:hypothetical protein [Clostridium tyrobutyricum]MBV4447904.1 hypothetical protein [Clostridium tyrobutyricum]
MKKKLLIILPICVLIIILVAAGNYYKEAKTSKQKAQYMNQLKDTNKNSKVIATVDNQPITENDLKIKEIFNDNNLSNDKLLDNLIRDKVLFTDAKNQNLVPSDTEVQNRVNEVRKQIQQNDTNALKKIKEYQNGLGISEDEYWNKIVFNKYKESITINNLIRKENELENNTLNNKSLNMQNKVANNNQTQSNNNISNNKISYEQTIDTLYNKAKQTHEIKIMK